MVKICFLHFFFCCFLTLQAQLPVSLPVAVREARNNNPYLKTRFFDINVAQSNLITAKLRPNLTLNNQSLQLLRSNLYPEGTNFYNKQNHQIWWQLTKKFQLPAQRQYKSEFASRQVLLEKNRYADLERNQFYAVANAWVDVWILATRFELLLKAKANVDSLVKINENRFKNQVITQVDLTRTQLLSGQYALQIRNQQQDYANALQNLKLQIGTSDSLLVDIASPVENPAVVQRLDSLMNHGLSQRSDIKAAISNTEVASSNVKLQKALAYPVPELGIIWNPQNGIPYLGFYGTVELPVFNRNQGERQKSKILEAQAAQNLQAVQFQARNEIETAYKTYQNRKQSLVLYQTVLSQSDRVLNTVRYAYLRGGTTLIDFLEAQRTWYDTRQAFYDASYSYYQSYVQLLFVTGFIDQP